MGILHRNLQRGSILHRDSQYGVDVLTPPNDEQYVVASTSVAGYYDTGFSSAAATDKIGKTSHGFPNGFPIRFVPSIDTASKIPAPLDAATTYFVINTAANDFEVSLTAGGAKIDITGADATDLAIIHAPVALTLATGGIALAGNRLQWPQRLWIVLRNRATATSGSPGLSQCSGTFAGNDQFLVRVVGKLNGVAQTEEVTVNFGSISTPSSNQRSYQITSAFFDEITSITYDSVPVTRGTTNAINFGLTTPLQLSVGLGACTAGDASAARIQQLAPTKIRDTANLKRLIYEDDSSVALGSGATAFNYSLDSSGRAALLVPGKAEDFVFSKNATCTVATDLFTSTAHGFTDGMAVKFYPVAKGLPAAVVQGTTYYVCAAAANTFSISANRTLVSMTPVNATDVIHKTGHGLTAGTPIVLVDIGNGIPTGLAAATVYWVIAAGLGADDFEISATDGGAQLTWTGSDVAVGVLTVVKLDTQSNVPAFANGDVVAIYRPSAKWRRARLSWDNGDNIEAGT